MAELKLNIKAADAAKEVLDAQSYTKIRNSYINWAKELRNYADQMEAEATPTSIFYSDNLWKLQKEIERHALLLSNEVYQLAIDSSYSISDWVVKSAIDEMVDLGFDRTAFSIAYSNLPTSIVSSLATGKVYKGGWNLSRSIWGDMEDTKEKVYSLIAGGVAQNKSVAEIAKEVSRYVDPTAKKLWNLKDKDGRTIYPKRVEYNSQRLVRTLIQHSYQQSIIETSQENPFIQKIRWIANGHRACPLCIERARKDSGLGPGVYTPESLPLDHPNGMCVFEPVIDDNIEDRLVDWYNNPNEADEKIDAYARKFGYNPSNKAAVLPAESKAARDKMVEQLKAQDFSQWEHNLDLKRYRLEDDAWNNRRTQYLDYSTTQLKALTQKEQDAIRYYSTSAYEYINETLRTGTEPPMERISEFIDLLASAFEKKTSVLEKEDYFVRETSANSLYDMLMLDKDFVLNNPDVILGQPFSVKGYMSTSLDIDGFDAKLSSRSILPNKLTMVIKAEPGAKAIYIEHLSTFSDEHEMLFPHGTKAIVEGYEMGAHSLAKNPYISKIYVRILND